MEKRFTFFLALAVAFAALAVFQWRGIQELMLSGIACAEEDWSREFDDVCSRTQDAMALSDGELTSLIARCDTLKPVIERLDESRKKVYLKRLQMCRSLFAFVLESRKK